MNVFIIDAFTDQPFRGNPAAVCLVDRKIDPETMQSIASEFNLSETAFLKQADKDDTRYSIRFFTPKVEIDFCGHATLASAKLILHRFNKPHVEFATLHNLKLRAFNEDERIKMIFSLYDTTAYQPDMELYNALGIDEPKATKFAEELQMLLIEVADKNILLNLNPDFLKATQTIDTIKEVVVTAISHDNEYDFYSRCFCPWIGINEDPVTGASHSVLAKYWSTITGRTEMLAYQASKRGGFMRLRIINDTELEVVSDARIIFEGIMHL
jgi:PhzF family phenazine biosynthesis protein